MKFEIKSRWSGSVLFSLETDSLRLAAEAAVKSEANLRGADLHGANLYEANLHEANLCEANLRGADLHEANLCEANLRGADLHGADLRGANLYEANLHEANLCGADMRGADLRGANLCGADMRGADLRGANLRGADLHGANLCEANLRGADLCGADLRGADLRGADMTVIRDDMWAVLSASPAEAVGLRQAILDGKIDGIAYDGDCACLVGTIAKARHCKYDAIPSLRPNSSRPAERFFLAIKPGDTPENSQFSKLALEWVDQFLANMRGAFGAEGNL